MKIINKKIIITGGAGFIGSNLTKELLKKNRVIVIDNFSSGSLENLKELKNNKNLTIIKADIRNEKEVEKIIFGADIIYHLAVQCIRKSFKNPVLVHDVNATGTLKMCMAAVKNKIKRFVYISSSEVYGTALKPPINENHSLNPTTVYGASKLAGEEYSKSVFLQFGLPTIVVRPFNTYGYKEHFKSVYGEVIPRFTIQILNDMPPTIFGDGNQTRDFTFVSDTVRGIILASENDKLIGQEVNIARGKETSINKLYQSLNLILGKKLRPRYLSPRPSDINRQWADISKAKNVLNYNPKINIEEGLKLYVGWLLKKYPNYSSLLKHIKEKNW